MIGFDIGGTKCAVCVGNIDGDNLTIVSKESIPTDLSVSACEMIDRMCSLAEGMTDDFSDIGISCGGPLDSQRGVIMSPPNLHGWDNVEIVDYLKKRYGGRVSIQNDANACAAAEWKFGAGRGCKNMVFLTFGTGLGAGLILDSKLYSGTNDMAGEAGHIRLADDGPVGYGKAGSFEGFCSGGGIGRMARAFAEERLKRGEAVSFCPTLADLDDVSARTVALFAGKGCEDALEIYRRCGERLGQGLAILIDILNPEKIVIGSIFQRSGHLLRDSMNAVLQRECLPHALSVCEIVPAELGDSIGDYAALSVAAINSQS